MERCKVCDGLLERHEDEFGYFSYCRNCNEVDPRPAPLPWKQAARHYHRQYKAAYEALLKVGQANAVGKPVNFDDVENALNICDGYDAIYKARK